MKKEWVINLTNVLAKIIKTLEEKEDYETENATKLVKLLSKILDILIKLSQVPDNIYTETKDDNEDFDVSEIAIMEDYILKLKKQKQEKGEKTWDL